MSGYRNLIDKTLTALLFIILEAAALLMLSGNDIIHRQWLARGTTAFRAAVWGSAQEVADYFALKGTNESLAASNSELLERLINSAHDTVKQAEGTDGRFSLVCASIVKGSVNRQRNYFILDKGASDGICPDMGVITDKGVVGIVDAVTGRYSYVISFMNPQMNVSARIGPEGPVGRMIWDGKSSRGAILGEIPLHTPVSVGDTIYTSGFSSMYPADIPLGTVTTSRIKDGASLEIGVRLFQEFRSLKYVSIVRNRDIAQIDSLMNAEVRGGDRR